MNKGFTLIELLVVVLIIGILAAIALPQYQKAVERSRMAEAVQGLGDLASAQQVYYMQHGRYAADSDELNEGDIQLALPEAGAYEFSFEQASDDFVRLLSERTSGVFENGVLGIAIRPTQALYKFCQGPEGFCPMAEFAGYVVDDLQEVPGDDMPPEEDLIGEGDSRVGGKICPLPHPECLYGYDTTTCSCKMNDGGGAEVCEKCGSGGSIVLTPGDEFIISPGHSGGGGTSSKCKLLGTC